MTCVESHSAFHSPREATGPIDIARSNLNGKWFLLCLRKLSLCGQRVRLLLAATCLIGWLVMPSMLAASVISATWQEDTTAVRPPRPLETTTAASANPSTGAQDVDDDEEDADDESITGLNEQTVYIPYEKLREVFERDGRGVFLTYEKFQQLWDAAHAKTVGPEPAKRALGAVIQSIDSQATIGEAVVTVAATLEIEIPPQGWSEVPLRLADAAIQSATIDEEPARIVFDGQSGYKLVIENSGEEAITKQLKLQYLKGYQKLPGTSSFSVSAPQAPINRWSVTVPESGVDVVIEPMVAATRLQNEDGQPADTLVAFVGAAEQIRMTWNPKSEGAAGLEAFATVRTEQQMIVGDGVLRTVNQLTYEISRAAMSQLQVRMPNDHKITNVFDRNIRKWDVTTEGDKQVLTIELFEPVRDRQQLVIELEKFIEVGDGIELQAPLVEAVNVGRQQGVLVARLESGLQGETRSRVGLLQMDPSELGDSLRSTNWAFAFRYGATPYDLTLAVRKVAPRLNVFERIHAQLTAQELAVNWLGEFNIQDAGVFQLAVDIPSQYEVRGITGQAIQNGSAASVESFHRDGDDETRWIINLSQRAFGRTGVLIELRRRLEDPNLQSPTGTASTIPVDLPHVAPDGVEHSQGQLVVSSPETLRVNPAETSGLRTISFEEAGSQTIKPADPSGRSRPVLAYAFSSGRSSLSLSAERRKPYVVVQQLLQSEVQSGVIRHSAKFYYDIKYSGVPSLRIDIPSDVADQVRNVNASLRNRELDPQPDDVAEDYVAWELSGESELLGAAEVALEWEEPIDELGLGSSREFEVPRLIPRDVDRATGQIALIKSETIDLFPIGQPTGLVPMDPKNDLMPQADRANAAMAFSFVGDWSLTMKATRYELKESKRTSIERAVVRVVVLPQGTLSVQALYRMRSVEQRLAIQLPETAELDAQPMKIDGQSVTPEEGAENTLYAPLASQSMDDEFVLELRYVFPGDASSLTLPTFPTDPAIQKVYLCAYLSPKVALVGSQGPWNDEAIVSERMVQNERDPIDLHSDRELIAWVASQSVAAMNSAATFPIGRNELYVFSTLRPADGPEGALALRTMNRLTLQIGVFVVLAIIGLPLYGRSLRLQIAAIGLVIIAVLVTAVLLPRLSLAIYDQVLAYAIGAVLVLWAIGHLRSWIKKLDVDLTRALRGARRPSATAAATHEGVTIIDETTAASVEDRPPIRDSSSDESSSDHSDEEERS